MSLRTDMLTEGNILYFDPFYFKNGNLSKSKYFVLLKIVDSNLVIASLPTSVDAIPEKYEFEQGCLELPDINFHCYVIQPNFPITECGKSFPLRTLLYGHQLDDYSIKTLNDVYPVEGVDYMIWGKLKQEIFQSLLSCFRNSKSVKQKFRKIL